MHQIHKIAVMDQSSIESNVEVVLVEVKQSQGVGLAQLLVGHHSVAAVHEVHLEQVLLSPLLNENDL